MKRALRIAAVLLLFGAIVNVGVAWASAAWLDVSDLPWRGGTSRLDEGTWWSVTSQRSAGVHRVRSIWSPTARMWGRVHSTRSAADAAGRWRSWLEPASAGPGVMMIDARGWPMVSMWSAIEFDVQAKPSWGAPAGFVAPGEVTRIVRGVELSRSSAAGVPWTEYRVLPVGIVWTGFATNTVALAALGAMILGALDFSRRAIRAGAGRCPRCAYFLRDGVHDRCPECGRRNRMEWIGIRGARWTRRAVLVGWSGAVVASIVLGGAWVERARNWKPEWWLIADARSPSERRSSLALRELLDRMRAGELTNEAIRDLVAEAIKIQQDRTHPWSPLWGDMVDFARSINLVSVEELRTFIQQSIAPELRVRPEIVEGDPVAAAVVFRPRVSSASGLLIEGEHHETRLGDLVLVLEDIFERPFYERVVAAQGVDYSRPFDPRPRSLFARALVEPGDHVVRTWWRFGIEDGANVQAREFSLDARVLILPRGSETVQLVPNEALRTRVESALELRSLSATRHRTSAYLHGSFSFIGTLPIDLAFDVVVRAGKREWLVGQIDSENYEVGGHVAGNFVGTADGLTAENVDIILRPSQAAARRSIGITRIWDGTVVIEDVPVEWARR